MAIWREKSILTWIWEEKDQFEPPQKRRKKSNTTHILKIRTESLKNTLLVQCSCFFFTERFAKNMLKYGQSVFKASVNSIGFPYWLRWICFIQFTLSEYLEKVVGVSVPPVSRL